MTRNTPYLSLRILLQLCQHLQNFMHVVELGIRGLEEQCLVRSRKPYLSERAVSHADSWTMHSPVLLHGQNTALCSHSAGSSAQHQYIREIVSIVFIVLAKALLV